MPKPQPVFNTLQLSRQSSFSWVEDAEVQYGDAGPDVREPASGDHGHTVPVDYSVCFLLLQFTADGVLVGVHGVVGAKDIFGESAHWNEE